MLQSPVSKVQSPLAGQFEERADPSTLFPQLPTPFVDLTKVLAPTEDEVNPNVQISSQDNKVFIEVLKSSISGDSDNKKRERSDSPKKKPNKLGGLRGSLVLSQSAGPKLRNTHLSTAKKTSPKNKS